MSIQTEALSDPGTQKILEKTRAFKRLRQELFLEPFYGYFDTNKPFMAILLTSS